jgi:hypothetical protein
MQNTSAAGESMPKASAKELGSILGVDGILTASVQEFTSESIGVPVVAYSLKTRLTLTLFDCATGGSVCATGMQQYSKNYTVHQIKEDNAGLYEGFLHSSAEKCAAKFLARYAKADWEPTSARMVKVFFGCNVLGADIQIDGLSYGTCPAEIAVTPGVHKLLVSYPPYYQEFRRDALFRSDGQTYKVVLQITPEGEKQRERVLEYEKKLLELKNLSRSGDLEYEKKKNKPINTFIDDGTIKIEKARRSDDIDFDAKIFELAVEENQKRLAEEEKIKQRDLEEFYRIKEKYSL